MPKTNETNRRQKRTRGVVTPNDLPDPKTPRDRARLKVTCKYRGKTYYEGDTIDYQQEEWQCRPGGWVKSKEVTPNHLANIQTPEDEAALQVTCTYLGKIFNDGALICYEGSQWQCSTNGWVKTGNPC
jgi:hypothetical protein